VEKCFFWLWKVQKGTSSLHREMERPSKQVAWGEEKFSITGNKTQLGGWIHYKVVSKFKF
jgi:hypothetical protein